MATVNGRVGPPVDFPTPGGTPVNATLDVQLCGYGSQIPRVPGYALMGRLTEQNITVDANGQFTFSVSGNDQIDPEGTYYTVTVRDANGDIAQVNAYQFLGGNTYDLSTAQPFDPIGPPPPIPPSIMNLLLVVPYSATPQFPGDEYQSWQITLAGDATATFTNLIDGNLYTIIIVQDATGGHAFNWPLNVYNNTLVDPDPNSTTVQTFVAISNLLYPIGAGTYYP